MDIDQAWETIVEKLANQPAEFSTTPTNRRVPVWFKAEVESGNVFVSTAITNTPASGIKGRRKLFLEKFREVYPFYQEREDGKSISSEIKRVTHNQVYYFSLIKHLL